MAKKKPAKKSAKKSAAKKGGAKRKSKAKKAPAKKASAKKATARKGSAKKAAAKKPAAKKKTAKKGAAKKAPAKRKPAKRAGGGGASAKRRALDFIAKISADPNLRRRYMDDPDKVLAEAGVSGKAKDVLKTNDEAQIRKHLGDDTPPGCCLLFV